MKHRTWITEALRLHFEEHLPRVVAGRRLGVPKSTVCSMFVRFRRAGLSWPLPAGMSEQELDACLYGQFSTVPVVRPESTVISEAPVVKKRPRRPNFPYEFKIALVEQSLQPGACVCVFRSIRSRIGIEVRSAIRIHSINRELNFFYRFLTRFFAAFHYRGIFPQ